MLFWQWDFKVLAYHMLKAAIKHPQRWLLKAKLPDLFNQERQISIASLVSPWSHFRSINTIKPLYLYWSQGSPPTAWGTHHFLPVAFQDSITLSKFALYLTLQLASSPLVSRINLCHTLMILSMQFSTNPWNRTNHFPTTILTFLLSRICNDYSF